MWILSDAHGHMGDKAEQQERQKERIVSLLCASDPDEAERLFRQCGKFGSETCLIPACGIHPWHADRYELKDLEPWILRCPAVGEIGMDSVWCQVPLKIQEEKFRQQLELAEKAGKPVILHTKGQEKQVASIIRQYPNRYLVHWYSCEDYLEEYLDLDCWFSVGPDVWWNPAVQKVAGVVPLDRLLVETDGLAAVRWAMEEGRKYFDQRQRGLLDSRGPWEKDLSGFGRDIETETGQSGENTENWVSLSLAHTLKTVAGLRGIRPEMAGRQFRDNLILGFLQLHDFRIIHKYFTIF